MRKSTREKIRAELLSCRPNGLTVRELSDRLGVDVNLVRTTLINMEDTYVYKWQLTEAGSGHVAVWKCVVVPENAPRPVVEAKHRRIYDAQYRERKRKAKAEAPKQSGPKTVWVTPPPWAQGART